jgi:hypothetical protein
VRCSIKAPISFTCIVYCAAALAPHANPTARGQVSSLPPYYPDKFRPSPVLTGQAARGQASQREGGGGEAAFFRALDASAALAEAARAALDAADALGAARVQQAEGTLAYCRAA